MGTPETRTDHSDEEFGDLSSNTIWPQEGVEGNVSLYERALQLAPGHRPDLDPAAYADLVCDLASDDDTQFSSAPDAGIEDEELPYATLEEIYEAVALYLHPKQPLEKIRAHAKTAAAETRARLAADYATTETQE